MTEAPEIASLRENGQRGDCANAGKRLEALKVRVAGEEFLGAAIQVIPLMIQFQVSGQLQPEGLDSRRIQSHRKTDAFEFGLLGTLRPTRSHASAMKASRSRARIESGPALESAGGSE
jgi:hypothetical protein